VVLFGGVVSCVGVTVGVVDVGLGVGVGCAGVVGCAVCHV